MNDIVEHIAYLTAPSGRKYQVLNEDGTDWDEAATVAAYQAGEKSPATK
jgi:hypothetical protein